MAASWSNNPNKGLDVYRWIDENLDPELYEFTFVGRAQMEFRRFRHVPALPSDQLAALMRENDVFLTASLNDPCSNSVVEALTVGLPCLYRKSGGHSELVGEGGIGFDRAEEIPGKLETVARDWESCAEKIRVPSIREVAERYLEVLEVHPQVHRR